MCPDGTLMCLYCSLTHTQGSQHVYLFSCTCKRNTRDHLFKRLLTKLVQRLLIKSLLANFID